MENQSSEYLYNDDIDLKAYVKTILKQWVWIVLASFLAGGLVMFYLSLRADTYVSTALVSVSAPILDVEFESSITTTEGTATNQQNSDLPNLALSDEIVFNLYDQLQSSMPENIRNHIDLKNRLSATTEARSGIIELSGQFNEPEFSALVVGEWSKLFVETANLFFQGSQAESQVFLEQQLANARQERDIINAELIEFEAINRLGLIQTQLESSKNLQKSYINRRSGLEVLLYDIEGLQHQIEKSPDNPNVLSELSLISLQHRAFGTTPANVQLQISSFDSFSNSTLAERVALLESLVLTIKEQQATVEGLVAELEPTILFYQQQIQELNIEEAELESRRVIVHDTYDSLALKVAESKIEENNTSGKAQIASRAIVPVQAESNNRLTSSLLAAIVAAMLVVGVILIRSWWLDESGAFNSSSHMSSEFSQDFANGNNYSVRPTGSNGNGAHPTEKEEFPAND